MPEFCHIVLLRFKPDIPLDVIDTIFTDLRSLITDRKIPGLLSFSGGPYSSPEGLNKGFTHAFTMTFAGVESRDAYFPHPDHELVKNKILAVIGVDDVIAFDYQI